MIIRTGEILKVANIKHMADVIQITCLVWRYFIGS